MKKNKKTNKNKNKNRDIWISKCVENKTIIRTIILIRVRTSCIDKDEVFKAYCHFRERRERERKSEKKREREQIIRKYHICIFLPSVFLN